MDVLLNPDKFFMEKKEIGFKIPIAIVLISAMTSAILAYFVTQSILESIQIEQGGLNLLPILSALAGVSAILVTFLTWIILTAILYFLSAIFKGKGDFSTLMKFSAFGFIPPTVLSPVNLYLSLEILKSPILENLYAALIFSAVVAIWQYLYFVFAVKNARGLSVKNSAIVCAIPIVIWFAYSIHSLQSQLEVLQMLKNLKS